MSNRSVLTSLGAKGPRPPDDKASAVKVLGLTLLEDLGPVDLDQTRLSILVLLAVVHGGQGDDGCWRCSVDLGNPGCCCVQVSKSRLEQ